MNLERASNYLMGTSLALVSSGMHRSVTKSTSPTLDNCARSQLRLGLSLSSIAGLLLIYKTYRTV